MWIRILTLGLIDAWIWHDMSLGLAGFVSVLCLPMTVQLPPLAATSSPSLPVLDCKNNQWKYLEFFKPSEKVHLQFWLLIIKIVVTFCLPPTDRRWRHGQSSQLWLQNLVKSQSAFTGLSFSPASFMGWPALSCGGDSSQAQWGQPNAGNPRASEQSWAWLVHKFGDFQANLICVWWCALCVAPGCSPPQCQCSRWGVWLSSHPPASPGPGLKKEMIKIKIFSFEGKAV